MQQAAFDLVVPDLVIRLQGFHAHLALMRGALLADPDDLESRTASMPLQGDYLAYLGDALGRYQPHSDEGDLIGAAGLGLGGSEIGIDFDWYGDVQPVFTAIIGYGNGRWPGYFGVEPLVG